MIDLYGGVLNMSEIAEKCGYTDYVYFSRSFKEVKGLSPREYSTSARTPDKK
jgi:YesN/AraC family two-component response regulator